MKQIFLPGDKLEEWSDNGQVRIEGNVAIIIEKNLQYGLEEAVRRTFDLLDPMVVEPDRRPALTRAINEVAKSKGLLKKLNANLSGDDVREGIRYCISQGG